MVQRAASQNGHVDVAKLLLENGAKVDLQDNDGRSSLMLASQNNHVDVAKLLLVNGAKVDLQKTDGWSSLMAACKKGHVDIAQLLLENGAKVDLLGWSSLMAASGKGHVDVAKLLLENGAKVNLQKTDGWSSLMAACKKGRVDVAKLLLDNGAKVDLKHNDGRSSLMLACQNGRADVAQLLLENGAMVDLQENDGRSSLMLASQNGHVDVAQLLLDNGAKVDLKHNDGRSSLMLASQNGHVDVAQLLLDNGAKVHLKHNDGRSSLMLACQNGRADVAQLLLENGAIVDLQENDGRSSLMLASQNGRADVAQLLLENGAMVDLQENDGRSSLMLACQNGYVDVAQLLLENGAKVNLQENNGWSSLMLASQNGRADVAKFLLENGAMVDLQDNDGRSSLILASQNGHIDAAKLLLNNDADIYLNNEDGQMAQDIAHDPEIKSLFSLIRAKDSLPGVLVSEGVTKKKVTLSESCVDRLRESGFSLSFPKDSLPSSSLPLEVSIQPCFSGPFVLPDNIELASPAYVIKPSRKVNFIKDVTLKIRHYANLRTDEDCKDMVFLTASSSPKFRDSNPVYVFKEMKDMNVSFKPKEEKPVGEVALRHFCISLLGKRKCSNPDLDANQKRIKAVQDEPLYSARLYKIKKKAIFCVCLFQPLFIEYCDREINSKYSSDSEKLTETAKNGVIITSTDVGIKEKNICDWTVSSDIKQLEISRHEIERQLFYQIKDLLTMDYPPRIVMTCKPKTPNPKPLELDVKGFNKKFAFFIEAAEIVDTFPCLMKNAILKLRKEINLQSKTADSEIYNDILEIADSILRLLNKNPSVDVATTKVISNMLADLDGKCEIILDSAKHFQDMKTHIMAVTIFKKNLEIYHHRTNLKVINIGAWQYGMPQFRKTFENLMNSIRELLQSLRKAHALPHNSILPESTPPVASARNTEQIVLESKVKTFTRHTVKSELIHVVKEWDDLGGALGLPHHVVVAIKANHLNDVKQCMKEVVDAWFEEKGNPPSWKNLCGALRDPLVDRKDIASNVEKKYLSS